jgi:hypothetical protein
MYKELFSQYSKNSLQQIADQLETDYYTVIEKLCSNASIYASELQETEEHQSTSLYLNLSRKLIEEILHYIRLRKNSLLPYIHQLLYKEEEGHDCKNCSASCAMQHDAQLAALKESNTKMKELLYRLQLVSLPLYFDHEYPDNYKKLRTEIMIIDTTITELFYLEQDIMLPKILESRQNINAYQ